MSVQHALMQFNGVTESNFNSNQEVEGRLYVGGDLTGSTLQVGITPPVSSSYDALVVNGQSSIGTINVLNGNDITVRGAVNSNVNMNGNGEAHIGGTQAAGKHFNGGTKLENQSATDPAFDARFPSIDFATFIDEANYLSTLSGVAPNLSDHNNKKFVAGTPDSSGLFVFNTTAAALSGGGLTLTPGAATTMLINVSGVSVTVAGNVLGGFAGAPNILWNFYEATTIAVNTKIVGSVLAPLAHMSGFSGSTEGSVIAKSINLSNGELHSQPFAGIVPTAKPLPAPVPTVPLPAALPLLLGGLAAISGLRLRRKIAA
ncbi:hypothetical protein BV911_01845 [Pseudoruegeria sp. SK021]|nr:hypothetical protein BV911_01845 [Pseudoruegeria sp. SK021]